MRITMIGSGNVSTHLAAALKNAGHRIIQVFSPNIGHASLLAYHVGAGATDDISTINAETDLYIIAVKDDAIANVAKQLAVHQRLIVHTSGATSLGTLSEITPNAGVFYPLQTFSKEKELDFRSVPLCIEGADEAITKHLIEIGQTISNNIYRVDSAQRKILHLSAVFACNFPNYLYYVAQKLLAENGLDFNLLRPLIMETAEKVQQQFPAAVQTGPAVRNDVQTMAAHEQLLEGDVFLQNLYRLLNKGVMKMEKKLNISLSNFVTFAPMNVYNIKINFEEKDHESVILPIAEGESVLDVCLENGIELQHNCGGVCGCSTCHIYVNKGMDNVQEISDKEEDFIDRAINPRITSRLGCQCVMIGGDIEVTLPDQSQFMGH